MGRPPKDELEDACARWGWNGAAEEYGVDRATIVRWLRESEMEGETQRGPKLKPKAKVLARKAGRPRQYDHDKIRILYGIHRSTRVVAELVGCNESLVARLAPPQEIQWCPMSALAKALGCSAKAARSGHRKGDLVKGYCLERRTNQGGGRHQYEYSARREGIPKATGRYEASVLLEEHGWGSVFDVAELLTCNPTAVEKAWKHGRLLRGVVIRRRPTQIGGSASRKWDYAIGWPS